MPTETISAYRNDFCLLFNFLYDETVLVRRSVCRSDYRSVITSFFIAFSVLFKRKGDLFVLLLLPNSTRQFSRVSGLVLPPPPPPFSPSFPYFHLLIHLLYKSLPLVWAQGPESLN